jgi:opacity protein-like surface antigen
MFFRNVQSLSLEDIQLVSSDLSKPEYELILTDLVNSGWSAGGTVTINTWKHFSNEFSYFRQQGKYEFDALTFTSHPGDENEDENLDPQRVGITTRQFEYNLLAQLRPPTSRWRPYIAAGPVFQLIALVDSPLKKPAGPFSLGLKNIGLIKAAFDFGNTPALDGGGIFQFGLQYGAGIKYRLTPHTMLRADYRETWSANPDMIKSSYVGHESLDVDETYTTDVLTVKPLSKFLEDRFTIGIGFAF